MTGILDNGHDGRAADEIDADVLEETGREQRLDRAIGLAAVELVANLELKIRANGLRLDAAIALDVDIANDLSLGRLSER